MKNFHIRLTQKVSNQSLVEGILLLVPTYLLFGTYIVTAIIVFLNKSLGLNMSSDYMTALLNVLFDFFLMVMAIIIFKYELISQFNKLKRRRMVDIYMEILIGIGIIYLLNVVGNMITLLTTSTVGSSANQTQITTLLNVAPILMIVCIVIFAPVLEEIIFRLMIFTGTYQRFGRIAAYIISAGLFGFLHVYSAIFAGNVSEILQIFPYLFMGAGLCFVYEKADNIYIPICAHALINVISVIAYL